MTTDASDASSDGSSGVSSDDSDPEEGEPSAALRPGSRRLGSTHLAPWRLAVRGIGLLLFVIIITRIDLAAVGRHLAALTWGSLGLAAGLCALVVLVKSLRWHVLLGALGAHEPLTTSAVVYTDAIFWGTLTPGRLGEFRKVQHLVQRHGLHWLRGTWWSLLDRLFDLAALLLLTLGALPVAGLDAWSPGWLPCGVAAVALVCHRPLLRLLRRLVARGSARLRPVERALTDLLGLSALRTLALGGLTVAGLTLNVALIATLASSLPFRLSPGQVGMAVALTMAAGLLPISYMNFGSREAVLLLLFRGFGRAPEDAIAFAFLFVIAYVMLIAESAAGAWMARRGVYARAAP